MNSPIPDIYAYFEACKREVIRDKGNRALRPTDEQFDLMVLGMLCRKVGDPTYVEELQPWIEFCQASGWMHFIFKTLYANFDKTMAGMDITTEELYSYIIAALNREYKVVWDKRQANMAALDDAHFMLTDMMNYKLEAADGTGRLLDARAALETFTDSASLLLNYLRHLKGKAFHAACYGKDFAGRLINMLQSASVGVALKHEYDDTLYNGGIVLWDEHDDHTDVVFDHPDHQRLRLLRAGDLIFTHRRAQKFDQLMQARYPIALFQHITDYSPRRITVQEGGLITLRFCQEPFDLLEDHLLDMQVALDSFYEFLDPQMPLPQMANITLCEALSAWAALQSVCSFIVSYASYDVPLHYKKDFVHIPRKIRRDDLVKYINRLTGITSKKVKALLDAMTADLTKYNDIWSAPLYPTGDGDLLLPFYPIIMTAPFHVVDQILKKGGCDLDQRGQWFERYLYEELTTKPTRYPVTCIPAGKYKAKDGAQEEIDLIIDLRHITILVEAKCIHYSMERSNYHDAWKRLSSGCEQAKRKAAFVKAHPELFPQIKDLSTKEVHPIVVTNYPTFTGLSHEGVYITDSVSLLAYLRTGVMGQRAFGQTDPTPLQGWVFYKDETEYSSHFKTYMENNPLKEELMKSVIIDESVLFPMEKGSCIVRSATVRPNPAFTLS